MELLTTITSLLGVGDMLMSLRDKFRNRPNKDSIVFWLKEVADLIENVADDLDQGRYPHSKCAQMQFYLTAFYDMIKNEIPLNHKERLFELIDEAYKVEKLLGELRQLNVEDKEYNLNSMRSSAGTFRAMSDYIKLRG